MRRAALGVALALGILAAPPHADAQQPKKVPVVGFLANIRSPATEGFQQGLRELGYVEGQTIIVEWRLAQGRFDRLPELAAELVALLKPPPSFLRWYPILLQRGLLLALRGPAQTSPACRASRGT